MDNIIAQCKTITTLHYVKTNELILYVFSLDILTVGLVNYVVSCLSRDKPPYDPSGVMLYHV